MKDRSVFQKTTLYFKGIDFSPLPVSKDMVYLTGAEFSFESTLSLTDVVFFFGRVCSRKRAYNLPTKVQSNSHLQLLGRAGSKKRIK